MRNDGIFLFICTFTLLFTASCDTSPGAVAARWKMSREGSVWQDMPDVEMTKGGKPGVSLDLGTPDQAIDGFGGAFNEKGWIALSLLAPEKREEALAALFDPVYGARFAICRIPIGASDYAESRYTLDDTPGDFAMARFSIERDRKHLIPYVKAAMKHNPDLRLWGSAWTPPPWMKTNNAFDGGYMKDDPAVYDAYALYLLRFIESYGASGIPIFCVAVQNEPRIETHYPSCLWTPEQFLAFIKNHAGPLFEKTGHKGKLMLGTIQDGAYPDFPMTVLTDREANAHVPYVGFQWDGLACVSPTRRNFPDKNIMQTETECGNWFWRPDFEFNPDKPQNDWAYGVYTWKKVKAFVEEGVNSYLLWNMVLDEEGKSIDSVRPWPQNAAIVVDRASRSLVYTPMFYAFKHFSYFVKPGARYVGFAGRSDNAICFVNPDGELVIELQNERDDELAVKIGIGRYTLDMKLPPRSWSTVSVPKL